MVKASNEMAMRDHATLLIRCFDVHGMTASAELATCKVLGPRMSRRRPGLNSLRRRGIDPAVLVVKLRTSPEAFAAPIYAARDSRLCADTAASESSPDAFFDSFLESRL
jgi:hypothetical protein